MMDSQAIELQRTIRDIQRHQRLLADSGPIVNTWLCYHLGSYIRGEPLEIDKLQIYAKQYLKSLETANENMGNLAKAVREAENGPQH